MKKKTIDIGFLMEYEDDDQVCHYGLFLRENEVKAVDEKLQELQRKDNEIKQLREDIVNHIKIASEYKEQMIIKDNNWNELKKWVKQQMNTTGIDISLEYKGVLDKIKELEENK